MLSFLKNHLPILMAARIDEMDVAFSEASFRSRVSVCWGWGWRVGGGWGVFWPRRAKAVNTNWTLLPL